MCSHVSSLAQELDPPRTISQAGDVFYSESDSGATQQKTYLQWAYEALGFKYALIFFVLSWGLPIASLVVVIAYRRPAVIASCLPFTLVPTLVGVYGTAHGIISIGAISTGISLHQWVYGVSTSMFTTLLGISITLSSLLIVSVGLFIRTVKDQPKRAKGEQLG